MILTIIEKECCATLALTGEGREERIIARPSDERAMLCVQRTEQGWCVVRTQGASLGMPLPCRLTSRMLLRAVCEGDGKGVLLYVEGEAQDCLRFDAYDIPTGKRLSVGPEGSDIAYHGVGAGVMTLIFQDGVWRGEMAKKAMPVYVNGMRFEGGVLKAGDMLYAIGLRIVFLPGRLCINNPHGKVSVNGAMLKLVKAQRIEDKPVSSPVHKPFARRKREPRVGSKASVGQNALCLHMGYALSGKDFAIVGGRTPLADGCALGTQLALPSVAGRGVNESIPAYVRRIEQVLSSYAAKLDVRFGEMAHAWSKTLGSQFLSVEKVAARLMEDSGGLWERRERDEDAMFVRLGAGNWPIRRTCTLPETDDSMLNKALLAISRSVCARGTDIEGAPIVLDVRAYGCIGIVGSARDVARCAQQILLQLVMQTGYDEMKLFLLGCLPGELMRLRRLPHTWSEDGERHFTAQRDEELNETVDALEAMLAARRRDRRPLPRLVIVLAQAELCVRGKLRQLLFGQENPGVHVIVMGARRSALPEACGVFIGVHGGEGMLLSPKGETLRYAMDSVDVDTRKLVHIMENACLETPGAQRTGERDGRRLAWRAQVLGGTGSVLASRAAYAEGQGDAQEHADQVARIDSQTAQSASEKGRSPARVDAEALARFLYPARPLYLPVGVDARDGTPVMAAFDRHRVNLALVAPPHAHALAWSIAELAARQGVRAEIVGASGAARDGRRVRAVPEDEAAAYVEELYAWRAAMCDGRDDGQQRLVILPDAAATLKRLEGARMEDSSGESSYRELLSFMMERVRESWHLTFIVCAPEEAMAALRGERWYAAQASAEDALRADGGQTGRVGTRAVRFAAEEVTA